jgi:hypothetical protein
MNAALNATGQAPLTVEQGKFVSGTGSDEVAEPIFFE